MTPLRASPPLPDTSSAPPCQLAKICRATGEWFSTDGALFFDLFAKFVAMLDRRAIHARSSWLNHVRAPPPEAPAPLRRSYPQAMHHRGSVR